MSRKPTLGNLFSGSGTWELAAEICGIDVLFEAEIEPFPVALEAKRFPNAIQLGDVSKINGAEIPPVDIFCSSSPCQDLSIAGKRAGLEGQRSGLFTESIRITKEMLDADRERLHGGRSDDDIRFPRPRFWCWENVPGSFSSNKGEDFRIIIEEIARLSQKDAVIPLPRGGGHTPEWSRVKDGKLPGEQWMPNITESLREGEEFSLSQTLEDTVLPKYFLSERACLGILRRSQKRGKTLPEVLEIALVRQAGLSWTEYEALKMSEDWQKP